MLQGGKHFSRKVAGFLKSTGVIQWLFLRGESAHAERTPVPGLGGSRARGGVGPRGQTAARLSGTSLPRLPSSILPARAGARAPRCLPRGLASSAPSGFLRRPPASFLRRLLVWRLGRTARETTSCNFPVRATFPHLGDCSSRGGEVRASSLSGRLYNLHGNYF